MNRKKFSWDKNICFEQINIDILNFSGFALENHRIRKFSEITYTISVKFRVRSTKVDKGDEREPTRQSPSPYEIVSGKNKR